MLKFTKYIATGCFLLTTGCGQFHAEFNPQQIQRVAPQSNEQTGYLLTGADKQELVALLEQEPQAKVRILSEKHGAYEVFNIDRLSLKYSLTNVKIVKNKFFPLQSLAEKQKAFSANLSGIMDNILNGGLADNQFDVRTCKTGFMAPTAKVSVLSPQGFSGTVELGQSVKFSAAESSQLLGFKPLKKAWVIQPSMGSLQPTEVVFAEEVSYTSDAMGAVNVTLVVQDENQLCSIAYAGYSVTSNVAYIGPSLAPRKLDLSPFKHLEELQAAQTWNISTGKNMTIAIIDSGVNYNHEAIRNDIAVNELEIPNNGIDDDNNGLVDDYSGYDFVNYDEFAFDDGGHGSHVAGLAASSLMGMAKDAKVIPIKALSPTGSDWGSVIASVYYAAERKADVINLSLGGYQAPPEVFQDAFDYVESQGILVVAAAGNGDRLTGFPVDTDIKPNYPSALENDNILAVAAKGIDVVLAPYSNYGKTTVDVVAPGGYINKDPNDPENNVTDLIYSLAHETPRGNKFIGFTGTSMAAPIVAGIAAQVMALNPSLTVAQVKTVLMTSGQDVPELADKVASGKHLSALEALEKVAMSLSQNQVLLTKMSQP